LANKLFYGGFSAESIFAVCQAVSLAVLLLAAKIQDGCLKIKSIIITRVASSDCHYDDRKTLLNLQGYTGDGLSCTGELKLVAEIV